MGLRLLPYNWLILRLSDNSIITGNEYRSDALDERKELTDACRVLSVSFVKRNYPAQLEHFMTHNGYKFKTKPKNRAAIKKILDSIANFELQIKMVNSIAFNSTGGAKTNHCAIEAKAKANLVKAKQRLAKLINQ